ncbi:uncharacterized protein LOC112467272 [Temnothorax curvispinosus]|uniref:Uncharacterized protein LOC112467272 n=1 Tax=Temnothorax curvispinosus TaxID=300111 RepID=A0A6J1RBF8_9HYME|nr:uncharacterized protein LOC112467272 [Temnothorax curvispinosus]
MLKSEYMEKMSALLGDETTYSIIDRNPTRKIISTLVSLLTRWKNKKYITQQEYRSLHVSDGILPRAYGLPKIHKPDCPLRIIVSSINTPLYDLASFLQKILHKSLPINGSSIKDSFTLVEKLNNKEQTHGSPMRSPLSPDAAEIVMRDLENKALKRLKYIPPFYFRYVDDVASAAPLNFLQDTLNIFNSIHNRLQFTIEISNNNTLNFLDTTIIAANERLIFDWYHKPTFSGRYLSFFSSRPNGQKRGVAMGLIDRAFRLSHTSFHQKNLSLAITLLLENGYPLDFVFAIIVKKLSSLLKKSISGPLDDEKPSGRSYLSVPYVKNISEKFTHLASTMDEKLSFYGFNRLNGLIKVHKDTVDNVS